jgi:hypothetical protein
MQKPQTDPDGFSLAFMAEGKADADFHNSETLTIKARIVRCKPESERTQRDGTGKGPVVRNCSMDETFAKTGLMLDRVGDRLALLEREPIPWLPRRVRGLLSRGPGAKPENV